MHTSFVMDGQVLVALREELGLTQKEMAAWYGMQTGQGRPYPTGLVSRWENGHRPVPSGVEAAVLRHVLRTQRDQPRKRDTHFETLIRVHLAEGYTEAPLGWAALAKNFEAQKANAKKS